MKQYITNLLLPCDDDEDCSDVDAEPAEALEYTEEELLAYSERFSLQPDFRLMQKPMVAPMAVADLWD